MAAARDGSVAEWLRLRPSRRRRSANQQRAGRGHSISFNSFIFRLHHALGYGRTDCPVEMLLYEVSLSLPLSLNPGRGGTSPPSFAPPVVS